MKIKLEEFSSESFRLEWEQFIASEPGATIFHHPVWLDTISQSYGYKTLCLTLRADDGEVRAVLPIAKVDSFLTGRRWVAYPFSDYCYPLFKSEQDLIVITDYLLEAFRKGEVDPLEVRWNLPPHHLIRIRSDSVLHILKLDADINKVIRGIHPMHRRNIRQAEKRGVQIVWGKTKDDLLAFYRLHLETRRRQGVPIQPLKFFELLSKNVLAKGYGFILLAYYENQCIAGAVFLCHKKTITYKYGASRHDLLNLRANNLIFWRAIQWGCENNYFILDFGKTALGNLGLREFKGKWGAEERELVYSSLSSKDTLVQGYENMLVRNVIKISPSWICRLMGELFYKHFA